MTQAWKAISRTFERWRSPVVLFPIITGTMWLFVVLRFLLPLPWEPGVIFLLALILFVGAQQHFLSRYFFGSSFSPDMPRAVGIVANALFGTVLLLATFQTVLDLLTLAWSLLNGAYFSPPVEARYLIAGSALFLSAFGVSQAIRVPPVKEIEIALPNLPEEFDGYRLIQLTDLHLSRLFPARWAKEVVARTNAQDADLIVITGDLMDGSLEARKEDVEPLRNLTAKDGVFVITGNHEYYYGHEGWMRRYQELGMIRLSNSHVQLNRGSSSIVLAGLTDSASLRFELPRPDVRKALEEVPPGTPIILLDHQPKAAPVAAQAGVALQLSGHTHGGMVLGLNRLVARFNNGFASGLYDVDGMQLYVNNGTALWHGFALRIGIPSELTVITLRKKEL